jgi:hypothetical protein
MDSPSARMPCDWQHAPSAVARAVEKEKLRWGGVKLASVLRMGEPRVETPGSDVAGLNGELAGGGSTKKDKEKLRKERQSKVFTERWWEVQRSHDVVLTTSHNHRPSSCRQLAPRAP